MEDDVPVEDLMKLKLIVVGNQGTGKSCILNRFVNETFEENYQATIGLDFHSKNITIKGVNIRLLLSILLSLIIVFVIFLSGETISLTTLFLILFLYYLIFVIFDSFLHFFDPK